MGKQLELLRSQELKEGSRSLVAGGGLEAAAAGIAGVTHGPVELITREEESLMQSRMQLAGNKYVNVRFMEFTATDFADDSFDVVYAQASVSTFERKDIAREFHRLLAHGGIACIGEIVSLRPDPPEFMTDIWDNSAIEPLPADELESAWTEAGFEVVRSEDLRRTLRTFYETLSEDLLSGATALTAADGKEAKWLLKQLKHEARTYLKGGGDKFMGYNALILKKKDV